MKRYYKSNDKHEQKSANNIYDYTPNTNFFFTALTVETDYWVLDTDYETYSLVYSCQNINDDERLGNANKFYDK